MYDGYSQVERLAGVASSLQNETGLRCSAAIEVCLQVAPVRNRSAAMFTAPSRLQSPASGSSFPRGRDRFTAVRVVYRRRRTRSSPVLLQFWFGRWEDEGYSRGELSSLARRPAPDFLVGLRLILNVQLCLLVQIRQFGIPVFYHRSFFYSYNEDSKTTPLYGMPDPM